MFSIVHKRLTLLFFTFNLAIVGTMAQELSDSIAPAGQDSDSLLLNDSLDGTQVHPWQDEVTRERVVEEDFTEGWTFNRTLDQAISFQQQSDRLEQQAVEWRIAAEKMDDPLLRSQLQRRIMRAEDSVTLLRRQAQEQFEVLAESLPGTRPRSARHRYLQVDTIIDGMTVYQYQLDEEFLSRLDSAEASAPVRSGGGSTGQFMSPSGMEPAGFRILDASPYSASRPFEEDFELPPGVFYRIQLAVFQNPPGPDHFGGLAPITTEKVPDKDLRRYFVGKFRSYEAASRALQQIRLLGYRDAFIVGYFNGQRGTFNKLKSLESQQSSVHQNFLLLWSSERIDVSKEKG